MDVSESTHKMEMQMQSDVDRIDRTYGPNRSSLQFAWIAGYQAGIADVAEEVNQRLDRINEGRGESGTHTRQSFRR